MILLVCICSLVFVCGVSSESPTHPQSDNEPELSSEAFTSSTEFDYANYSPSSDPAHAEEDWKPYSSDVYPLFKKAIQELASSERGILIFWDSMNRPEPPRAFFEQVFRAYNRMVDEGDANSKAEEYETTMDDLDSTEQTVSELVPDVHAREELVVETEDPEAFYHASVSSDGDAVDVYYTTENPEAVVLDESYAISISPEQHTLEDLDTDDLYKDASTETEVVSEAVDSEASVLESLEDEIVRRSGVLVERETSTETSESTVPLRVGSIRGIPCVDFPCYEEIPITSFTCADKLVPGFYADLETGCQVFHVCWPNRRESFLCPIGTTFNQPIAACDYWYSSNCSLSQIYFESKTKGKPHSCPETSCDESSDTEQLSTEKPESHLPDDHPLLDEDWFRSAKFVPVKTKVTVYFKSKVHSKLPSKKTVSKTVTKQKQDIMPLMEVLLDLTETVAKDSMKLVPKVIKPEITKSKFERPATKLVPCLEIKDHHHKPTPTVVEEPKPLPTLNPRFIVKPVNIKKPFVKVHYEKKKVVSPKVLVKQMKPLKIHKTNHLQAGKDHASEIVLKALEMAGDVFQRDVLALTRQAMKL